jgi:hypothetical protein
MTDFLSLKNDVKYLQKLISKKNSLEGHWRKYQDPEPDPDPLVRGADPQHPVKTSMKVFADFMIDNF